MINDLLKLTKGELLNACIALGITPVSERKDHLIAALITSGKSIGEIKKAMSAAPVAIETPAGVHASDIETMIRRAVADMAPAPGVDGSTVKIALDEAIGRLAKEVRQALSERDARMTNTDAALAKMDTQVADAITSIGKSLTALKDAQDSPPDVTKVVAKAVAEAFKPMHDAFTAAPVEVQERVRTIVPRERKPIKDVFGLENDLIIEGDDTCEVWGAQGSFDPDYIWNTEYLTAALMSVRDGDNFWLYGQRGTGKSEFARNFAARLGRPFYQVSCHENLESADFIGAEGLKAGDTEWQDGIVLKAYRTDGAICLIDEATLVRPSWTTELHRILEPKSTFYISRTGELVHRAPGMVFIAADNTNGCGDESGRFSGTKMQNSAYIDRFAYSLRVDFLPEATEIQVLVKRGAVKKYAKALINVFTRCRAEVGASLIEPPSLRQAFAFCKLTKVMSPERAWEWTVINKSPEISHEALRQLFSAHWSV